MSKFWDGNPSSVVTMDQFDVSRVELRPITNDTARNIIVKYHYTHSWPVAIICLGLYIDNKLNGVVVYGHSATPRMENSLPSANYLELQRLFSFDWAGRNTESYMISQSIKYIKKYHSNIECLVSFADPNVNHNGTIYQASNWLYCGLSDTTGGYQYLFDGQWQHARSTVAKFGTRMHSEIIKMFPNIEFRRIPRKYRYIYILSKNKAHKKQLMKSLLEKYQILPYPKRQN
jgi:hypothetical protein